MSNICQLIIRNFYLQKSIFAVFVFRTPVGDRRGCRGCDSKAKIEKTIYSIKNMKKNLLKGIAVMAICSGSIYLYQQQAENEKPVSDLALANVEALASGEGGNFRCLGYGDVECYGYRVRMKFENLR